MRHINFLLSPKIILILDLIQTWSWKENVFHQLWNSCSRVGDSVHLHDHDKTGLFPDKVALFPDKTGLFSDETGLFSDKTGLLCDE